MGRPKLYLQWAKVALDTARLRLPYQRPTYRSVVLSTLPSASCASISYPGAK
jgi:hypothetical protein